MYNGLVRQTDPAISRYRVGIDIGSYILRATIFFVSFSSSYRISTLRIIAISGRNSVSVVSPCRSVTFLFSLETLTRQHAHSESVSRLSSSLRCLKDFAKRRLTLVCNIFEKAVRIKLFHITLET